MSELDGRLRPGKPGFRCGGSLERANLTPDFTVQHGFTVVSEPMLRNVLVGTRDQEARLRDRGLHRRSMLRQRLHLLV